MMVTVDKNKRIMSSRASLCAGKGRSSVIIGILGVLIALLFLYMAWDATRKSSSQSTSFDSTQPYVTESRGWLTKEELQDKYRREQEEKKAEEFKKQKERGVATSSFY